MEKYGTIFESNFNLQHDKFRDLLVYYYGNPTLIKIKNANNVSLYLSKVESQLLTDKQYIIATCNQDKFPIGTKKKLQSIKWIAFQTRLMPNHNSPTFKYNIPTDQKFNINLYVKQREKTMTTYNTNSPYPIAVSLIHDTDNLYQYPNTGTLLTALETFKTVITFK